MPFVYSGRGVASQYYNFACRLLTHPALKGPGIPRQVLKETPAQMHVRRAVRADVCQTEEVDLAKSGGPCHQGKGAV